MIGAKEYLQWVKSFVNGIHRGLMQAEKKDEWTRGAIWAVEAIGDHIDATMKFINTLEEKKGE